MVVSAAAVSAIHKQQVALLADSRNFDVSVMGQQHVEERVVTEVLRAEEVLDRILILRAVDEHGASIKEHRCDMRPQLSEEAKGILKQRYTDRGWNVTIGQDWVVKGGPASGSHTEVILSANSAANA